MGKLPAFPSGKTTIVPLGIVKLLFALSACRHVLGIMFLFSCISRGSHLCSIYSLFLTFFLKIHSKIVFKFTGMRVIQSALHCTPRHSAGALSIMLASRFPPWQSTPALPGLPGEYSKQSRYNALGWFVLEGLVHHTCAFSRAQLLRHMILQLYCWWNVSNEII